MVYSATAAASTHAAATAQPMMLDPNGQPMQQPQPMMLDPNGQHMMQQQPMMQPQPMMQQQPMMLDPNGQPPAAVVDELERSANVDAAPATTHDGSKRSAHDDGP